MCICCFWSDFQAFLILISVWKRFLYDNAALHLHFKSFKKMYCINIVVASEVYLLNMYCKTYSDLSSGLYF